MHPRISIGIGTDLKLFAVLEVMTMPEIQMPYFKISFTFAFLTPKSGQTHNLGGASMKYLRVKHVKRDDFPKNTIAAFASLVHYGAQGADRGKVSVRIPRHPGYLPCHEPLEVVPNHEATTTTLAPLVSR